MTTAGRQSSLSRLTVESRHRVAWEQGGADFQSRFDKSTALAEQMKEGAAGSVIDKLAVNIAEILIWEATHMLLLLGRF